MASESSTLSSRVGAPVRGWHPTGRDLLRALGRVLLGVAIAVVIVIAVAAVTSVQAVALPPVTGPSAVGRTQLALTDTSRADPFLSGAGSRELAIWIWYPVASDTTAPPADYFPATWAALPATFPFAQDLTKVSVNAHQDAPLDGTPPVVILQPGLGLPVGSYTALAEDLASHGYAVVGINETGSAGTVFPDGHVVPATAQGNVMAPSVEAWYADAERVTNTWAADARFVVQSLEETPPPIGALDFSRVAYVGHSVGGASAFEACRLDSRCAAAVDLDGTLWTEVRRLGLAAPHLLVQKAPADACDEFCTRAAADFETVMADGGRQVSIAGSTHPSFQDDSLMPAITSRLGQGSIDGRRMTAIVRDTVRAFLDVHVLGVAPSEFAAALDRYAEVSVVR